MKLLRPACLVLLSTLVAPVVPAAFAQAKSSKASSKASPRKRSTAGSAAGKSSVSPSSKIASSQSSGKNGASAGQHASSSTRKKSSGRASSGKASSRLRRQPGQKAPTSDRITEIQSALAKDGSFAGEPTGKWDDSTTAAMRKFQAAHGLSASGKLDAPTLQRLGLGSTTAGVARPTPPPGSVSRLSSAILTAPAPDDAPRQ